MRKRASQSRNSLSMVANFVLVVGIAMAITPLISCTEEEDRDKAYILDTMMNLVIVMDSRAHIPKNILTLPMEEGHYGPVDVAVDSAGNRVYTINTLGNVSVIDAVNDVILGSIDLVGVFGETISVSPCGSYVFVLKGMTFENVVVCDVASNLVVSRLTLSGIPKAIGYSQAGDYAYVATSQGSVYILDVALAVTSPSQAVVGIYQGMDPATPMAVQNVGGVDYAFIASSSTGTLTELNLSSGATEVYSLFTTPTHVTFDPDGQTLYVADDGTSTLYLFDILAEAVTFEIPEVEGPTDSHSNGNAQPRQNAANPPVLPRCAVGNEENIWPGLPDPRYDLVFLQRRRRPSVRTDD